MGDRRSKEDDVLKIFMSIYVTNFPEHINAKELWRICSHQPHVNVKVNSPSEEPVFKGGAHGFSNSYIQAFKTGINFYNAVEYSKPSLVLDESCFHNYDFSLSLVGQLKEFGSLPNLKKILEEEGKIFWIRVKEVIDWALDFLNSHDDSSESDDESAEGKSKDVYSEKVSEAGAILETIFEVEEPDLNATIQSKGEPKYPLGFTPRDTSDINSLGANNQ
ncbi:hypothetical protein Tco_1396368, partial [Tanacetum coccineum]